MKLYKIIVLHAAPKDTHEAVECFAIAENDKIVYRNIDKIFNCDCWETREEEETVYTIYDDDYNDIGQETERERRMRLRGEINDEEAEFCDAYYGITLYGWDEGKEISDEQIETLLALGVAVDWRKEIPAV